VRFKAPDLSRTAFNRMSGEEQRAWQRKILEKGLTLEYDIAFPSGVSYTINKTQFDYADRGEPLPISYDLGYLSPDNYDRAKRVTREKHPAIFAREASAARMAMPEPPPAPVAAPSVSAEERLAAKIAASNDAGLARLQAMLNG